MYFMCLPTPPLPRTGRQNFSFLLRLLCHRLHMLCVQSEMIKLSIFIYFAFLTFWVREETFSVRLFLHRMFRRKLCRVVCFIILRLAMGKREEGVGGKGKKSVKCTKFRCTSRRRKNGHLMCVMCSES